MFFAAPDRGYCLAPSGCAQIAGEYTRAFAANGTRWPPFILAIPREEDPRESLVGLRILSLGYHDAVPTFYVENFGCRATQADGAAIERQFQVRGLDRASSAASAALVILNTCTVTASADQDARAAIRRVRRQNPAVQL